MNQWVKKILLNLYGLIPLKRELFSVIRFIYIPSERIFRHLYFKGKFNVAIDAQHGFMMQHYGSGFAMESDHFWKGVGACEPYSIDLWIQYAKQSELILDIGANTGTYSLIAASLNPKAEIHAFEPVRRTYEKLTYNNQLNSFSIHSHNIALSSEEGEIYLVEGGGENEYTAHVSKNKNEGAYSVACRRLDTAFPLDYIGKSVLMKLDVERHETEVLHGMGDLFKRVRPVILLEVLDQEMASRLNIIFENMEYVFLNVDEVRGNFEVPEIQKSFGNNIFCCPKEKYTYPV